MLRAERRTPDEGAPFDDDTFAPLEAIYKDLTPEGRIWLARLSGEARRNGVSFHAAEAHTVRRFEILRGLIALADRWENDDDYLRTLVASVVDADWPLMPAFPTGHVVGALNAEEAVRFAELACATSLTACVDDNGNVRLTTV